MVRHETITIHIAYFLFVFKCGLLCPQKSVTSYRVPKRKYNFEEILDIKSIFVPSFFCFCFFFLFFLSLSCFLGCLFCSFLSFFLPFFLPFVYLYLLHCQLFRCCSIFYTCIQAALQIINNNRVRLTGGSDDLSFYMYMMYVIRNFAIRFAPNATPPPPPHLQQHTG